MKLDLKSILKTIKLNESKISMALGAVVLILIGVLVVKFNQSRNRIPSLPPVTTQDSQNTTNTLEHIVISGENLWSISEKYYNSGYNWVDLVAVNKISNPNQIEAGQVILLPNIESRIVTVKNMDNDFTPIHSDEYIVNPGDSLWEIAVRAYGDGYKWVDIAKANNLANPNTIHSGNVLKLP